MCSLGHDNEKGLARMCNLHLTASCNQPPESQSHKETLCGG